MSEIRLQLDLARNSFNFNVDLHLPAKGSVLFTDHQVLAKLPCYVALLG